MRTVEDADHAAPRQLLFVAPEVVVVQLLLRGNLEGMDVDPLRIDAAHHVLDGAVFARRIKALEHDEERVGILGGQPVLVFGEERDTLLEQLLRLVGIILIEVGREAGVEILGQGHLHPRLDAKLRGQLPKAFESRLGHAPYCVEAGDDPGRLRPGNDRRKVAPAPFGSTSCRLAPCACAIAWLRASPRPAPPLSRAPAPSSRTNRSKRGERADAGMPGPSSWTSICQPPAVSVPVSRTAESLGACRMALSIRLSISRRSRSGSAETVPESGALTSIWTRRGVASGRQRAAVSWRKSATSRFRLAGFRAPASARASIRS